MSHEPMPPSISDRMLRRIHRARCQGRTVKKGKRLPSVHLLGKIISKRIIWEVVEEERVARLQAQSASEAV